MDNQTDTTVIAESFTDKEIFTKIWTSPRAVIKYINDNKYEKFVAILLILAGIARAFDRASNKDMGDTYSLWTIIGICVVLGGSLGWIAFYIYAYLVSWTGKWLKANGDQKSILRVLAYAMIPIIVALLLVIPQIGIYGIEVFKSDGDITSAGLVPNIFFYGSMILELVLAIWTLVLCVVGISEVQKLSKGNAILNLLLPVLIIAVPILLLTMFFSLFN
tara:strand:+ start:1434 stop:2090 length:657 start_codon:yes stop_codon:yes gene_type:complete